MRLHAHECSLQCADFRKTLKISRRSGKMTKRRNKCLICCTVEDYLNPELQTLEMEQLSEMFKVLCHYMDWKIKGNCQLDFNVDPFPFCKSCLNPLKDLYKFHLEIQELLKGTQRIKWWMTSVLLDKFQLKSTVRTDSDGLGIQVGQVIKDDQQFLRVGKVLGLRGEGDTHDGIPDLPSFEDKLYCYQRATYRRYVPSVSLSRNDLPNLSENEMGSTIMAGEVVLDYDGQEITDDACLKSDQDWVADLPENCSNCEGSDEDIIYTRSASVSQNKGQRKMMNVRPPLESNQVSVETAVQPLRDSNPEPVLPTTTTSLELLGVNNSENEEDAYVPHKSHLFESTKFASRIDQVGINRFSFDKKLLFECVNSHEWKCLQCQYTTLEKRLMTDHLSSIGLRCNDKRNKNAIKAFKYEGVWYDQLKDQRFECRRCPTQTNTGNDMKIHIDKSHSARKKRGTSTKDLPIESLMKLFIQEGEEGELKCDSCQVNFESREAALEHVSDKHKNEAPKKKIGTKKIGANKYIIGEKCTFEFRDRRFHCDECNFQCSTLRTMKSHVYTKHFNEPKKVCQDCGQEFRLVESLRQHRIRIHPGPPTVQCEDCGKGFPTESRLNLHRQCYHGEKTFMCDVCGLNFATKNGLSGHKRSHVSVTCTICGKVSTKLFIKAHMQSHSRQFECDKCHKKFPYKGGLRTHKNSCGEQSKFSCDVCGMKFTQKHTVTRHKKRKHKEQEQAVLPGENNID